MRLEQGTNLYVERRQASGISFATGYKTYRAFCRRVGNLTLSEINVHHVLQFLDRPQPWPRPSAEDIAFFDAFSSTGLRVAK